MSNQADISIGYWIGFLTVIFFMLALDLFVFHKKVYEIKYKEALGWSIFWITLALIFNLFVYWKFGFEKALEFLTAYIIEESLSVDNIFVFLMIFSYFNVSPNYQHRVLFWGILGAIIMRGIFIIAGTALIRQFAWIIYVFGGFLVYTGIKMAVHKDEDIHPERNPIIKFCSNHIPITKEYHEEKFFTRIESKLYATPLMLVLIVIESSDIIFAVDSIPAVLAISRDPFIVFTSNIFAILGLRTLFFFVSGILSMFKRLKEGISIILVYVGIKMLISGIYHIPTLLSLGVIGFTLAASIIISIIEEKFRRKRC